MPQQSFPCHQAVPGGRGSRRESTPPLVGRSLSARIGQHMGGVAVHPGQPGDGDRDAGLLGDFPHHCCRGRFSDLDPTSGQLPGPVIRAAHHQHLSSVVAHHCVGSRQQVLSLRRGPIGVVLSPRHGSDRGRRTHHWTTHGQLTADKRSVNGQPGRSQPSGTSKAEPDALIEEHARRPLPGEPTIDAHQLAGYDHASLG